MRTSTHGLVGLLSNRARQALAQLGIHTPAELRRFEGLARQAIDPATLSELLAVRKSLASSLPRGPTTRGAGAGSRPKAGHDKSAPVWLTRLCGKRVRQVLCQLGVDTVDKLLSLDIGQVTGNRRGGAAMWKEICRLKTRIAGVKTADEPPGQSADSGSGITTLDDVLPLLNPRARHVLCSLGIETLDQFSRISMKQVFSVRMCGYSTWKCICAVQSLRIGQPAVGTGPEKSRAGRPMSRKVRPSWNQALNMLGGRARRLLKTLDITALKGLRGLTEKQVLSLPGGGIGTWQAIRRILGPIGPAARMAPSPTRPAVLSPFTEDALDLTPLFSKQKYSNWPTTGGHESWRLDTSTSRLHWGTRAVDRISSLGASTIGELLAVPANQVLSADRCGLGTLAAIQNAIRTFLVNMNDSKTRVRIPMARFDSMARKFLLAALGNHRDAFILQSRLGIPKGTILSLDDIGTRIGLTKERVRQIEDHGLRTVRLDANLVLLKPLWAIVDGILANKGGAAHFADLTRRASVKLRWSPPPPPAAFCRFACLNPQFRLLHEHSLIAGNHPCLSCERAPQMVQDMFGPDTDYLSLQDVSSGLRARCGARCPGTSVLSDAAIKYLIFSTPVLDAPLRVCESRVYTVDGLTLQEGPLTSAAEVVLRRSRRPMHFTEICKALRRWRSRSVPAIRVYNRLLYLNDMMLWGRGTFLHVDYVPDVRDLVSRVEQWLLDALTPRLPRMPISTAFSRFESECRSHELPSATALYSCLRRSAHPKLAYPHYPHIQRRRP